MGIIWYLKLPLINFILNSQSLKVKFFIFWETENIYLIDFTVLIHISIHLYRNRICEKHLFGFSSCTAPPLQFGLPCQYQRLIERVRGRRSRSKRPFRRYVLVVCGGSFMYLPYLWLEQPPRRCWKDLLANFRNRSFPVNLPFFYFPLLLSFLSNSIIIFYLQFHFHFTSFVVLLHQPPIHILVSSSCFVWVNFY